MTQTNDVIATEMEQLYALYTLQSVLDQIYTNLALISEGATGQIITVSNVSLFSLAAQYYGNADDWTVIAEANGLSDPMVNGTMTLTIPSSAVSTGGVLNAQ